MSEDLRVIVDADADPLVRELKRAGVEVRGFGATVGSQSRGARAFSAAVDKQKESLRGLGTFAKAAGFAIGGVLAVGIAHAIKTGMDFESQMARVKAVTGATGKEMDQLRKLAIKLGADTKFSALEAAEAMYELSSAGFDVQETSKALPGTLSLAAASSVDLATAAEISSNALRGFGLQSSESTHVADVLAQSVNSSSVEMEDLQLSLKYIGPVAKATGEGFEEMISAVSLMGDAGIKGEQAGTSLRGGLLRLVKPTKQVQEGLGALGIDIKELQGPKGLLPLPQLVGKLQSGLSGLSKAQQAQALAQVFGTEALSGMLTVVDAGPAKLARLTKEFEHSDGASAKAAKTMNDTVKGSFEQLKGSFETVEIELYEHFSEPLKNALLDATQFVNTQGEALQQALDEAMATPEFDEANVGRKAEILADAFGEVWKDSGLQDEIREGLITAFNYALPKVAAGAGHLGWEAAKGLVEGFFEADPLGKLVIGGWLFTKLGGFAALKAAGWKAGAEVAVGMTGGMETGAVANAATGGAAAAVAAGASGAGGKAAVGEFGEKAALEASGLFGAGTLASKIKPSLAKFGMKAGAIAGGYFAAEMGAQIIEGITGADILEGQDLKGALLHGFNTDEVKSTEEKALSQVKAGDAAERINHELRSGLVTTIADIRKLAAKGSTEAAVAWKQGSPEWRAASVRNMRAVIDAIKAGESQGVITAAQGQRKIAALLEQIHLVSGDDPFGIASGFTSSWARAGKVSQQGISEALSELHKMPPVAQAVARDTMLKQVREYERGGRLAKGSFSKLRSAVTTELALMRGKGGEEARLFASGLSSTVGGLSINVADALENIGANVSGLMRQLGATKIPHFEVKALRHQLGTPPQVDVGSLPQLGRQHGGIIPGIGDGDKVPRDVPPGTFIMNREATAAFGLRSGGTVPVILEPGEREFTPNEVAAVGRNRLEAMNSAVPRFQEGGEVAELQKGGHARRGGRKSGAGLGTPELVGTPGSLLDMGQGAINLVHDAAAAYLQKHQPKTAGASYTGPAFGPTGTSTYMGVLMATWVRQALEYAASKGIAPQPTSGYRSHAQNVAEGRDYFSEHEKKQYPGGAVDFGGMYNDPAAKAAKMAVVNATRDFKYPLLAPIGFTDDGHASGTGHMLGGLVHALSTGGPVPPSIGELVGASYYGGPTDGVSGTVGAAGVSLPGKMSFAELAMGKALGGLPFHTKLKIGYNGKSVVAEKLDVGLGGDDVGGHNRAIDLWYETANAIGLSGTGVVKVSQADGGSGAKSEKVPATYHGARTGSLDLGSMPNSLRGVERELKRRRAELGRYRAAAQKAAKENKPKIEQAIRGNITALESWIKQLERERAKMRREVAKKKMTRRLARAMGKLTGFEEAIAAGQHTYDARSQYAEQVVGLEPLAPELPSSATDAQREEAEHAYVKQLTDYINTQEHPAYEAVLSSAAAWRNTILGGEAKATGMEHNWEGQVRKTDAEIDAINAFTKKVADDKADYRKAHATGDLPDWLKDEIKKDHKQRASLPILRSRDHDLRGTLGEARGMFWRGVKDPITPPRPPSEGTGSFEDALTEVQGIHWPGQHEPIAVLPPNRIAGMFGGAIWDTQEAIEGLGLKISQAANGAAGSGGGEDSVVADELKELRFKQVTEELTAERLKNTQLDVLGGFLDEFGGLPYVGAFMQGTGGRRIGQSGIALVHRDEVITPDPRGPAGSQFAGGNGGGQGGPVTVQLVLGDKSGELVQLIDARVDGRVAKIDQTIGRRARQFSVAPGR